MGVVLDVGVGSLTGLAQALSALLVIAALGWFVQRTRALRRRGPVHPLLVVEERLPLDLRSALLIVRVEQRRFLLSTAERGPARLIAELAQAAPPSPGGPASDLA